MKKVISSFKLLDDKSVRAYDEAMAATCMQGIYNRIHGPCVYLLSGSKIPQYWLDLFTQDGEWLAGRTIEPVGGGLDGLFALTCGDVKGAVIWDPGVPATFNVATTAAGVEDWVVLSPEMADEYLPKWKLPVELDLRGMFDGSVSGSAKNDAYRWALEKYHGRCAGHWLFLYEDPFMTRASGDIGYVVTRDWAVFQRGFVYDLSPWGDAAPSDDPDQPVGTDLETYHMILGKQLEKTAGREMTEVAGFFSFGKYSNIEGHPYPHDPVPTEWETVWLISPYNCYQNTVASSCLNQSFHSAFKFRRVKQGRPAIGGGPENKTYLCVHMADYDSATTIYEFLPPIWDEETRGKLPLAWGVNPNLLESYPDIIDYIYRTRAAGDYFCPDASAAGYFNVSRIKPEYRKMVVRHNRRFFGLTDMSVAPMVLDWDHPGPDALDFVREFAPDGMATIIEDFHLDRQARLAKRAGPPHFLHKGMPVDNMYNGTCNFSEAGHAATALARLMAKNDTPDGPNFHYVRIVWKNAGQVKEAIDELRKMCPDKEIEVVDPYTYFGLLKRHLNGGQDK